MTPWREFINCRRIEFDTPGHTVRDLLFSDLGTSEFELAARDSFLEARGGGHTHNHPVFIQADAAVAVIEFLRSEGFRVNSTSATDRRLARLRLRLNEAVAEYAQHAWFHGRSVYGGTAANPPMTAWFDDYTILPTFKAGYRPVMLIASPRETGAGVNVSTFKIKEVDGWLSPVPNG